MDLDISHYSDCPKSAFRCQSHRVRQSITAQRSLTRHWTPQSLNPASEVATYVRSKSWWRAAQYVWKAVRYCPPPLSREHPDFFLCSTATGVWETRVGGGGVTIALRPGLPQDSRDPSHPSRDLWTYCCVRPITWKVPIVAFRGYSNGDGF